MNTPSVEPLIDPDILVIAAPIIAAVFLAAIVIASIRIIMGPSILDRMIGTDVLLATILCGLGAYIAATGRLDLLPVLLVLSMLAFVGSVSVSRFVSRSEATGPSGETHTLMAAKTIARLQASIEVRAQSTANESAGSQESHEIIGPLFTNGVDSDSVSTSGDADAAAAEAPAGLETAGRDAAGLTTVRPESAGNDATASESAGTEAAGTDTEPMAEEGR